MKEMLEKIDTKKMIYIVIALVAIIIIFWLFNFIGNKMFSKSSYEDVEDIMKDAAIEYYDDNDNQLPKEIGNSVEVDIADLTSGKYMKEISKYTKKKNVTCDGVVKVTNVNGNYRYNPMLDCGDDYQTITLANYIKDNTKVVESGSGLYSQNNNLVYRGDDANNYAKMGEKNFRIIKIEENKVVLIYTDKLVNMTWDDRYNIDKNSKIGINDYSVSRIKEYLDEIYDNDTLFTENEKLLLSNHNVLTGKRKEDETDKNNAKEGSNTLENQYLGLITVSDFLNVSLDSNCNSSTSVSCVNYNYLMDFDYSYWTITADSETSYKAFKIDSSIGSTLAYTNSSSGVQPVIYLVEDAVYVSGDGSLDNPYTFR